MSLGDELRYLRALHGGGNLMEIEDEIGLDPGALRHMEQRYRRVGEDDEVLAKIAAYYGVPLEKLQFHRERYRKALSAALQQALESGAVARFELRTGETLTGRLRWWDLGAFGLEPEDGGPLTVVQRHAVIDWPMDLEEMKNEQMTNEQ
jgi:transcriptional regulator with XRE-family HTH domain